MVTMDQKLRTSFHFVQNDMIRLENQQHALLERVERVERVLMGKAAMQSKARSLEYVGNRETRELHTADCILAKSMDRRHQMVFGSKRDALISGFSECICLC